MNIHDQRQENTRQKFIDIFCELYSKKPIDKITVIEMCKLANCNRSTFYQYFFSINDLLEHVEKSLLDYIHQLGSNYSALEMVTPIERIVELFSKKGKYITALMGDYGSIRFLRLLKKEFAIDESLSKSANPLAPYIIEFRVSTILTLFHFWERRNRDIPLDSILELIANLYTNGVSKVIDM